MRTIGYIGKRGEVHYFYSVVNNKITVQEFSGADGILKHKLDRLKAQAMLALFEDFLLTDNEIIDQGKNVHLYEEKRSRIKKYIEWGHSNIEIAPQSVSDNGKISTKYMDSMIEMISDEHPKKKELIFLQYCVTQTYSVTYEL